jgi:hypothetical protein
MPKIIRKKAAASESQPEGESIMILFPKRRSILYTRVKHSTINSHYQLKRLFPIIKLF